MTTTNESARPARPTHGRRAAAKAQGQNSLRVDLPIVGTVALPAPGHLLYAGGVGVLALLEVIEWPVAVALAAGHLLASSTNKELRDFGAALDEA